MVLQLMILGLFPAAMAFAAASDLVTMAISNRLSIALLVGFFVMAAMIGLPLAEVGRHVMACLLVLSVAFVFFALGWIGGGDAKLAAATALWIGFPLLLEYTLVAAIFGGMLTLMLLQLKRFPLPLPLASQPWITRLHTLENGIPYGIALAAAGLVVYPETPFMRALAV